VAIDSARWVNFVRERDEAMAFHEPNWALTLASAYDFEPFSLALTRADGKIVAGIPVVETGRLGRRWISLPFSDICIPLGDAPAVAELISAIEDQVTEGHVRAVEIRSSIASSARPTSRGVVHELELCDDAESLLGTFSKSQVRRNIARSRREGVVVRRGDRPEDLLEVFVTLHAATRRRHGLPCQPSGFFKHLWTHMIEPGHGFVLVADVDSAPAAAAVFLLGGKTVTYKYGASNSDFWGRRPNHLLFWEAIQWSCQHGYRVFDFGRSDWENEGLRAFKGGWGTTERELIYSSLGKRAFRPPESCVSIVQPVIRRSPVWLNRLLGSLLYRFAA